MQRHRTIQGLAGAVAGIGMLAASGPASASSWAETEPAVGNCVPYFLGDSTFDTLANHSWGVINYSSDSYALTCPITSQVGLVDATTLDGVQVIAYDGHSGKSVEAALCISNPTTGSVSCGATKYSGSSVVGAVALWLDPPAGTFYSYYTASVYVRLPSEQCTDSGLFGCNAYRFSTMRSYNVWRN